MRIEVVVERGRVTVFGDLKALHSSWRMPSRLRAFCRYASGYWVCEGSDETVRTVLDEILGRASMNGVEVVLRWRQSWS